MMSDMRREQHAGPLGVAIVDNDVCALDMMGLLIDRIRPPMTVLWKAVRAQDALEHCLFDERLPDVLVLDLALNGISGVDVCRAIRAKNGTIGIIGVYLFNGLCTGLSRGC
ncbi:MAG TPA: response regulator [Candidatus Merdibacter merdigallinarum]|nr:response regulator [Candidatus Merdibacter merdigallinarum]